MKKLFGAAELEVAYSSASPVQNITSFNRSVDLGVIKNVNSSTRMDSSPLPELETVRN
jgi:hypothetical protein